MRKILFFLFLSMFLISFVSSQGFRVPNKIISNPSAYALNSTIPTNNNQLINGNGFYNSSDFVISNYALTSTIPTNNNQLSNGEGYITGYTETDPIWTSEKANYVPYTGANKNLDLGNNNFSVGTSDLFVNSNTGNVGIGTTTPSYKLEVNGKTSADAISSQSGFNIAYVPAPTSGSGVAQTGTALGIGTYYYRVAYLTALGHTSTRLFSVTTTAGNQEVLLTIPVSPDDRVTSREIFRGKIGDPNYKQALLTTVLNNVDTTYLDTDRKSVV